MATLTILLLPNMAQAILGSTGDQLGLQDSTPVPIIIMIINFVIIFLLKSNMVLTILGYTGYEIGLEDSSPVFIIIMIINFVIIISCTTLLIGCLSLLLQRSAAEIKHMMGFDHICHEHRPYDTDLLALFLSSQALNITLKETGITFHDREFRRLTYHQMKMSIIAKHVIRNNRQ
jgi:hypothetical protein